MMPEETEVSGQIDFAEKVKLIETRLQMALRTEGSVLLIRPVWADGSVDQWGTYHAGYTETTHPFTDAVRQKALDEGWDLTDLSAANATRANVEAAFAEGDFDLVIHCDHGGPFTLCGQNYAAALDTVNINLASGTVTSTTSCQSASGLGPVAIADGVRAYLGYSDVHIIWTGPYASMFTDAAYTAHMALLECHSAQQAFDLCWAAYDTLYNNLLAMGGFAATFVAPDALHDRDCLTLLGTSSAIACPLTIALPCATGHPYPQLYCLSGHPYPTFPVLPCKIAHPIPELHCALGLADMQVHCKIGQPDMMLAICAAGPNILDTCAAGPPLIFREIYEGYPVDLVVVDMDKIPEDMRKPFRQMIDKMRAEG
jgi:hypothetical protein